MSIPLIKSLGRLVIGGIFSGVVSMLGLYEKVLALTFDVTKEFEIIIRPVRKALKTCNLNFLLFIGLLKNNYYNTNLKARLFAE
jgi:hypothetical protein